MRRATLTFIVFLTAATIASAATPTHPYRTSPTRKCMIRRHLYLLALKDMALTPNQIQWVLASDAGIPSSAIVMQFYSTPSNAAAHERGEQRTFRALKATKAWIRHHLTRRQNVVIENDFVAHPLTTSQLSTIDGCLRR
jgi:hypothetical protein